MGCFICPEQATVHVIENCGKFHSIAYPGFNTVCCLLGQRSAGKVSLRVQQLDVACETKSRDNVFVQIVVSVQYQVMKEAIYDAFYKLTDSRSQITAYVFDVVRASVPRMDLDEIFVNKEHVALAVKEELTKAMTGFGFEIIQALVTDIVPDANVRNAMNEINASQRLRMAAVQKAEGHKVTLVKAAEADAEAKFLAGQGIARQRQAIINGLRESVLNFSNAVGDVASKDIIEMMMITQYFDMLKDVGMHGKSGNSSIFLPHSPGAVASVAAEIRAGFNSNTLGSTRPPVQEHMDRHEPLLGRDSLADSQQ